MSKKSLFLGIAIFLFLLFYSLYWLNYFKVLDFTKIPLLNLLSSKTASNQVKPQTTKPTPPPLSPPPPLPQNPPPPAGAPPT